MSAGRHGGCFLCGRGPDVVSELWSTSDKVALERMRRENRKVPADSVAVCARCLEILTAA